MATYHIFVTYDDWIHDRYTSLPTDVEPGEDDRCEEAFRWCRQYLRREPYVVAYCPDQDDDVSS